LDQAARTLGVVGMRAITGKQLAVGGAVLALFIILPLLLVPFGQHVMIITFAEIVRISFNNWEMVGAAEGLTIPMLNESLANFIFNSSWLPYCYIIMAFLL